MLNFFLGFFILLLTSPQVNEGGTLHITLENIKNDKGSVRLVVFDSKEGWPEDHKKSVHIENIKAKKGKVRIKVPNLKNGTYAVVLLHDENENGKMDYNLVGIPKEGWAVSNNVKPGLRAPRFEEAAFQLKGSTTEISININY